MRRLAIALILLVGAGVSALATAPCFDACHLSQGQPLLAGGEVWVRPCKTVKKTETCTIERLDLDGRVIGTVPGDEVYDHERFEATYLADKHVVRLNYGTPWTDLKARYTVSLKTATMTLRLRMGTLICERSAGTIERPLGCTPSSLSVRTAGIGPDSKPEDPTGIAVVIASCGAGTTRRDVIVVCQARP